MSKITVTGRLISNMHKAKTSTEYPDRGARHSVMVVLDSKSAAKLKAQTQAFIKEEWPKGTPNQFSNWVEREGDDPERPTFEKPFIACYSASPIPGFIKRGGKPVKLVGEELEDVIYPGCNVAVACHIYKPTKGGASVSIAADMVLFNGDNERMGGQDPDEAFKDFEDIDPDLNDADAADPFADAA